jgi:hypothetical protein
MHIVHLYLKIINQFNHKKNNALNNKFINTVLNGAMLFPNFLFYAIEGVMSSNQPKFLFCKTNLDC